MKSIPKAPDPLRRFASNKPRGARKWSAEHPAHIEGRTRFPITIVHPSVAGRILKSGHNQRKIGREVSIGRWRGMPIWTLTLEERATCSRACELWDRCYGNSMRWGERLIHGESLEKRLWAELEALQEEFPDGFVVRLHILGDFYSLEYVDLWKRALLEFPALRVFGYTARGWDDPIGEAVLNIVEEHWDRFAIRLSSSALAVGGARVIKTAEESRHIICPAQTEKTACCATCGLCWSTKRTIEFLEH